jgi:hypothetical protein
MLTIIFSFYKYIKKYLINKVLVEHIYILDDTQFVIKWQDGYTPTFITDGSVVPIGTYDHHAILELMATSAWSSPIEEIV